MTNSATDTRLTAAPKILILGATGPTGRLIIAQALARGWDVAALVRSPEKLSDVKGVKLIVGDVRRKDPAPGAERPGRRDQRLGHAGEPVSGGDASLDRDPRPCERDEG